MNRRELFEYLGAGTVIGRSCVYPVSPDETGADDAERRRAAGDRSDDGRTSAAGRADGNDERANEHEPPDEHEPFDEDPHETYEIGDSGEHDVPEGVDPHELYVRNGADEKRRIAVRVSRDGEPVFERTEVVPASAYLAAELVVPGAYEVEVESGGATSTATVDRSWSGCARSRTIVEIRSGGIATRTRSVQRTCD